jgi:hypothetical protein
MANDHLTALANALTAYDNAVRDLIRDELEQLRPGLEQARDAAVERLRLAYEALQLPTEALAEIDAEIQSAERELAGYQDDLKSPSVATRVSARTWVDEWGKELESLRAKRTQQQEALQVFTDEHRAAKDAKADAEIEITALDINLETPFLGRGQYTGAYKAFHIGSFPMWATLIGNNTEHGEYDAFLESLDSIAQATGYRTDDLAERLRQQAIAEQRELFRWTPEPAPSGAEVVAETAGTLQYKAEDAKPSTQLIEDYRHVPRNVVVPSHMRTSRVPGEMRRV